MTSFLRGDAEQPPSAPPSSSIKDGDLRTPLALDDFMAQLAFVMRLPPKPRADPESVAAAGSGKRIGTRLWIPAAATALALGLVSMKLRPPPPITVPQEILGTWETADGKYAGRQIVFTDRSVVQLTTNGAIGQPERIADIATVRRGDTLAVTLHHESEGTLASLALAHVAGPVEHLVLRNPVGVQWYRPQDSARVRATASVTTTPGPTPSGKKPWEH